jgi:hypothetical protein
MRNAVNVFVVAVFTANAVLGVVVACTPKPSPAVAPDADSVYQKLVAAGCLSPSADGVDSVAQMHAETNQPAWMACLFDGGSTVGCGVPCE